MLVLLLLPILFGYQSWSQNPPATSDTAPIVTTYFRWFRDQQRAEKVVVPPRTDPPPTIEANQRVSQVQKTEGTAPERDPNLDKLENRSASLDKIGQESSESPLVQGFTYEVKFKNLDSRQAQTIFWEYQFKEIANPENTSRHRFVCSVKIKADKDRQIQVFSTFGPATVINVKNLGKGSGNHFAESVVIDRIEFEDGSVWQRTGWDFDQARFAGTKRGDRFGACRSF